jgi:hypothetical protein
MKNAIILAALLGAGVGSPVPAPPPLSVDFDRVIQDRFGHVTKEDIRQGRLGTKRIIEPTHRMLFRPRTEEERRPLERLHEHGWDVSVFVQTLNDPGTLIGPIRTQQDAAGEVGGREKLSEVGRRAIAAREPVQAFLGESRVEARPIPVTGPSCLGCHDPSGKVGDPLGAAVYVFTPRRMP